MKRVLVWMILAIAGAGVLSDRAPAAAYQPSAKTYATGSLTEMVYALPSDSGKLYLTVVGVKNDPKYQRLTKLFNQSYTPVRDEFHYGQLDQRSTMYRARYAQDYRAFPTVRLQLPDGTKVQEFAGQNIPADAELIAELKAECFRRRGSPRQPAPRPVEPVTDTPVQPVTDASPAPAPRWMWQGISWRVVLLALSVGVLLSMRDERKRKSE